MNAMIETELQEAERGFRALQSELDSLPSQLEAAAREANGARLLLLRRRRDELEAALFSARARVLKLRIEAAEARRAELRREREEAEQRLITAAEAARRAADEAQARLAEHSAVMFEVQRLENSIELSRHEIGELRSELAREVKRAGGGEVREGADYGISTGRRLTGSVAS
jgi:chromosome segregation ATPase